MMRGAQPASQPKLPAMLVAFVVSLVLLPEEASLFLGPLRLPVERALLLGLTPYAIHKFFQQIREPGERFVWSDALVPMLGIWMVVSVSLVDGLERAAVGAGSTALELVGAYFLARACVRTPAQIRRLAQLLSALLAVVGTVAVADPLMGTYVVHYFFAALTHYPTNYAPDIRHGLVRATSTLEHPILLGATCSFGMLLGAVTLTGVRRALVLAGTALGLISAISSAPILGTLIGMGCLAYRRLTPDFESRWRVLMLIAMAFLATIFIVLPSPFGWLIGHATLEPSSGYFRLMIWQFAGADLMQSPILGLGLGDTWARPDWMPPSVDSVWLRSAMFFGIPGALLLAAGMLGACSRRVDTRRALLQDRERLLGTTLSLILFCYAFEGFTVHFWGIAWTLLGLFMGMRARLGALGAARPRHAALPVTPRVALKSLALQA